MALTMNEVKKKIVATKKTGQITSAMQMVAAAKLQRLENRDKSFQYMSCRLQDTLKRIIAADRIHHPLLDRRPIRKTAYLIVTGDRGLSGAYNANTLRQLKRDVESHGDNEVEVHVIGKIGYEFCKRQGYNIIQYKLGVPDEMLYTDVLDFIEVLLKRYEEGAYDQLLVIYSQFKSAIEQVSTEVQVLPYVVEKTFKQEKLKGLHEYEVSIDKTADTLVPYTIGTMIFGQMVDSKTSETASRMTAMKNASENAEGFVHDLELIYNQVRQATITQEISEIVGGTMALE